MRKRISFVLFAIAALFLILLIVAFSDGDPKGFGIIVFAIFFTLAVGWIVGDY